MIVRPITKEQAVRYCKKHPHAPSLPNSSKYFMAAYRDTGEFLGLAVWGWGIVPAQTPKKLFGDKAGGTDSYLELNRFFVVDDAPVNSASQFLNLSARLIKKHAPNIEWLYTYAAGFQGLVGTIYKAAGYEYLGTTEVKFPYIKGIGMVHPISLYHRYKKTNPKYLKQIFGDKYSVWQGLNFCYIKFLCSKERRDELLSEGKVSVQQYPTKDDIRIWDGDGNDIDIEFAKTIPIVKLKSNMYK